MTTSFTGRSRGRVAVAALAAALIAIVTGCATGRGAANAVGTAPGSSPPAAVSLRSGLPVVLRFGDHAVAATLAGTVTATELAAMLPLRVTLSDAWRQAKSGRLPHPVGGGSTARTLRPVAGGIYYWPDTAAIAVYYDDDLGQSVPPPGLIRLGAVDSGLDEIAAAGRQVTVYIDRVAGPGV